RSAARPLAPFRAVGAMRSRLEPSPGMPGRAFAPLPPGRVKSLTGNEIARSAVCQRWQGSCRKIGASWLFSLIFIENLTKSG
ncbi:hypothetical protein, partial [Luteibacter sahnii]|uniref:hypothetical protein n=1 Tax=Luteibacter sahnii TaxID=3021977 RepID=UPI002A750927